MGNKLQGSPRQTIQRTTQTPKSSNQRKPKHCSLGIKEKTENC